MELQSQGLDGDHTPLRTVEEMAERYLNEIRKVQPQGLMDSVWEEPSLMRSPSACATRVTRWRWSRSWTPTTFLA